jgi:hypothetical protein
VIKHRQGRRLVKVEIAHVFGVALAGAYTVHAEPNPPPRRGRCSSDAWADGETCRVGRRTMRIEDYGQVAATFVDTETGAALVPRPDVCGRARLHAPGRQ